MQVMGGIELLVFGSGAGSEHATRLAGLGVDRRPVLEGVAHGFSPWRPQGGRRVV